MEETTKNQPEQAQVPATELSEMRSFAESIAESAGEVALSYFRRDVAVETKSDLSPVTVADRETEQHIRRALRERYPDHDVLGEEFGEDAHGSRYRWIIDPIDGTKAFVAGIPLYTTLVAVLYDGRPIIGVIRNGVLRETVSAAIGLGCSLNGTACRVSAERSIESARLQCTDYASVARSLPGFAAKALPRVRSAYTWADAYGYLLVATGRAEIMIDPVMSLWDIAPLGPIISEAGGRFTDIDGRDNWTGGSALATNGVLHESALALVEKPK